MFSKYRQLISVFIILLSIFLLQIPNTYSFTTTHTYDSLHRLVKTEYSNGTVVTYVYDPMGNRLKKTVTRQIQNLEVGDNGYEYTSIQTAIDEAYDGDTILVHDGIYMEVIDFKGKSITMKSENGPDRTILDGNGQGSVISFSSSNFGNSGIGSTPVLEGFTIKNGTGVYGGGIFCDTGTSPSITNNKIIDNSAEYGGGIYCNLNSLPTITQNIIAYNSASSHGGGIYAESAAPILRNNTVFKNSAEENGGAIASYQGSSLILRNNTFAYNTANDQGSGIYADETSTFSIINTILWDNGEELSGIDPNAIHYSNIKDEVAGGRNDNISQSPLFIDPNQGNYHLKIDSPCKNAGNPESQYNDLDGSRNDMGADGGPGGKIDTLIPLIEEIQAIPPSGEPPLQVSFIPKTSDEWGIVYYFWDFDDADGIQIDSNQYSPTHLFETRGGYLVTLKVTDHSGLSNTATIMITIAEEGQLSPTISSVIVNPQTGQAPLSVDFSVSAQDQDGSIIIYKWDFEGDGIYDWENEHTGSTSYTFNTSGGYQAQICVIDNDGLKDIQKIPITVVPEACTIEKMTFIDKGIASEIEIDNTVSDLKGVKVTIPQNALSSDTMITISEVQGCPSLPSGTAGIGLPVDFGPDGIQFSNPVIIGIPYDQDQLAAKGITAPHQLKMFYYSISDSCWKDVPIKSVDTVNQRILAEVTHFTVFQLVYPAEINVSDDNTVDDDSGSGYPAETNVPDDNTVDDGGSSRKGDGGCFIEIISFKWYR